MGIGDIRYTVLQVSNEVQRKLGLAETSLTANKLATQLVDFINDTCNDLSDFGNWQETIASTNVTAVSGQSRYSINTSANVKNIGDIFYLSRSGPMRNVTIRDMRIMTQTTATGTPTQYTVFGTDNNGNPVFWVRPTPVTPVSVFSVVYYIRTPNFTTADASTLIPFPGEVVVNGTLARALLNESGGAPTDHYARVQQEYLEGRKEALNRFNGDTGWNVNFTPSMTSRWRR